MYTDSRFLFNNTTLIIRTILPNSVLKVQFMKSEGQLEYGIDDRLGHKPLSV